MFLLQPKLLPMNKRAVFRITDDGTLLYMYLQEKSNSLFSLSMDSIDSELGA